jgi:HEAT repeat protein
MQKGIQKFDIMNMSEKKDADGLIHVLENEKRPSSSRALAATYLGKLGGEKALDVLKRASLDKDEWVSRHAIQALGGMDNPKALEHLTLIMNDPKVDKATQLEAGKAIEKARKRIDKEFQSQFRREPIEQVWNATVPVIRGEVEITSVRASGITRKYVDLLYHNKDVDRLIKLLKYDDPRIVCDVVHYLGRARDSRATEPLLELLDEKNAPKGGENLENREWQLNHLRFLTVEALGWIGNPKAVEPLIKVLLEDEDVSIRFWAAISLGRIRDPRAVPALKQATYHDYSAVRHHSMEALAKIATPEALSHLEHIEVYGAREKEDRLVAKRCAAKARKKLREEQSD